jgi:hypothetical protein
MIEEPYAETDYYSLYYSTDAEEFFLFLDSINQGVRHAAGSRVLVLKLIVKR